MSSHPPTFATRENRRTAWKSERQASPDATQWLEVELPPGVYGSYYLNPLYAGRIFISLFDGEEWLGEGEIPGSDVPYLRRLVIGPAARDHTLGAKYRVGRGAKLRVSFNPLPAVLSPPRPYRAGVVRLGAYKES